MLLGQVARVGTHLCQNSLMKISPLPESPGRHRSKQDNDINENLKIRSYAEAKYFSLINLHLYG
jgi:hypothetical protein